MKIFHSTFFTMIEQDSNYWRVKILLFTDQYNIINPLEINVYSENEFLILLLFRRCGDMNGNQWTGSKDSPNVMTLTFNSMYVGYNLRKRGFRLRFNAIERNGISIYPLFYWNAKLNTSYVMQRLSETKFILLFDHHNVIG